MAGFGSSNPNYKGHMHRLCPQCKAELGSGANRYSKYCSRPCHAAAQRTTNYNQVCGWCGKDFLHRSNKHCSLACAQARRDSTLTESGRKKRLAKAGLLGPIGAPRAPRSIRTCEICGKGMLLRPSELDQKYCSRACYGKAVSIRQTGEKHHMYKDGKAKARVSERHVLRRHPHYKEWRLAVYQRDEYKCRSCLRSDDTLHAHHIVPWISNPKLRLKVSNGVTLCGECHRLWHLYDRRGLFEGKESALQEKIIAGLTAYGAYVYNVPGTPYGSNGTPDLLVCMFGLGGGIEVKVFPNYLSELQRNAGLRIKAAGGLFYVAQSEDDIGRIIEMFELCAATGSWVAPEEAPC